MRICILALMLALCSTTAVASPKCTKQHVAKYAPASSTFDQLVSGFELRGGARWENADTAAYRRAHNLSSNKFYVGAGVNMPLNNMLSLYGGVDYKFATKDWQPTIELSFRPSKR